ncbi:MAG TPA: flavodoxin family protein [Bacilli bacterium]|nr:flavodoxin family protein [Bacilli bacterium]
MAKNIIVVTGSVRKTGNSALLANAFIKGARGNGNAIQRVETANRKFSPFRDKENAWRKGKPSLIEDDFNLLAPYLYVSDVLVLASPVYFGGFSSAIKMFIDNLYAFTVPHRRRSLSFEKAILLAVAREDEEDTFVGITHEFKRILKELNIPEFEIITVGGVHLREDIVGHEALERARELGKTIN